jgi:hypothetical protein
MDPLLTSVYFSFNAKIRRSISTMSQSSFSFLLIKLLFIYLVLGYHSCRFNFRASSNPSANVPTRASIA